MQPIRIHETPEARIYSYELRDLLPERTTLNCMRSYNNASYGGMITLVGQQSSDQLRVVQFCRVQPMVVNFLNMLLRFYPDYTPVEFLLAAQIYDEPTDEQAVEQRSRILRDDGALDFTSYAYASILNALMRTRRAVETFSMRLSIENSAGYRLHSAHVYGPPADVRAVPVYRDPHKVGAQKRSDIVEYITLREKRRRARLRRDS